MAKRGRPPKEFKFDDLPEELRYPIIIMMAKLGIKDFKKAYTRAGMLIDKNSEAHLKLVKNKAERLYRSRHFTELNKARFTIEDNAFQRGYQMGLEDGVNDSRIWYYCSVCGELIYITPNSDSHKAIIEYMRKHGWHHGKCA